MADLRNGNMLSSLAWYLGMYGQPNSGGIARRLSQVYLFKDFLSLDPV